MTLFAGKLRIRAVALPEALRSTWGTVVGLLSGLGAKLGLHLLLGVYGLWHFWPR